jgi:hypothetical protein
MNRKYLSILSVQPIQAFEHPTYQHMIEVAAQATRGVKIPGWKQTRQAIIDKFKKEMQALRDCLNVCQFRTLSQLLTVRFRARL